MKCYVIPPVENLELIKLGDSAFCLTQLYVKHKKYREYFQQLKSEGWWITMDSGIGDHDPVTQTVLFEAMKDLMPSEIIPVDTLFNKVETINNMDGFIERMKREDLIDKVEIFGCPQGSTKEEWIDCYVDFLANPYIKTIGMSKLALPKVFMDSTGDINIMEARHMAVKYLLDNNLISKPLHFLGMGDPREMIMYLRLDNPLFRSTDSCNSIWSAMNNICWDCKQFKRIKTPKDYFERIITEEQLILAKENINWFKNLLNN